MPWGAVAAAAIPIVYDMLTRSDAEKASAAQSGLLQQQSDLFGQLYGMFNRPGESFQNPALMKALSDKNLGGMAGGFARQALIKSLLGIGQPSTSGIEAAMVEGQQAGQSAAVIAQVLTDILSSRSDPGQSTSYTESGPGVNLTGTVR